MKYPIRVLISLDQFINTLFGGEPDETISAKLWRNRNKPICSILRKLVDKVFWLDPNHCETSYLSELKGNHLPREYKNNA